MSQVSERRRKGWRLCRSDALARLRPPTQTRHSTNTRRLSPSPCFDTLLPPTNNPSGHSLMIVAHTLSVLLGRTLAMNFAASLLTLTTCVLGLMGAHAGDGDTIANGPPATTAPPVTQNDIPRTVRLGKVPSINLGPQPPVTPQEAAKIKRLIASLASIDSPDFGLSS